MDATRNIRMNMGYLKEACIVMKEQKFTRTPSGKSWKSKPDSEETKKIPADWYHNYFDAVPFFRNCGGSESVQMGYTYAGYLPVQLTSISPERDKKIVRRFYIVSDEETARNTYHLEWEGSVA